MTDFHNAMAAWRAKPFPPDGASELLGELHADLALADVWLVEIVIPLVEHGMRRPAKIDVLAGLQQLQQRVIDVASICDPEDKNLAETYRDYVDLQLRAYEQYLTESG